MTSFEIIDDDAKGVRALLAAAEEMRRSSEDLGVELGVITHDALGDGKAYGVIMAKSCVGSETPYLVVTMEPTPRIVRVTPPKPDPDSKPKHETNGRPHLIANHSCVCTADCCNTPDGESCICPECTSDLHDHTERR